MSFLISFSPPFCDVVRSMLLNNGKVRAILFHGAVAVVTIALTLSSARSQLTGTKDSSDSSVNEVEVSAGATNEMDCGSSSQDKRLMPNAASVFADMQ